MQHRPMILCATVVALLFAACRKKDAEKVYTCRVDAAVRLYNNDTVLREVFTYAGNDQLMQVVQNGNNGVTKTYTYSPAAIIVETSAGGGFRSRDSIALNSAGRPVNHRRYTHPGGSTWENTAFTYTNAALLADAQLASATMTNSGGGTSRTITYTYNNGNVVSASDGTVYSYYENEPARAGDYLLAEQIFQLGVPLFRNKNMVRSIRNGGAGPVREWSYLFGDNGRVTKMTMAADGAVSVSSYTSTCK